MDEKNSLISECPICGNMFFACHKEAVPDAGDEIQELKDMGFVLKWVASQEVRDNFDGACQHVEAANSYLSVHGDDADWDLFWNYELTMKKMTITDKKKFGAVKAHAERIRPFSVGAADVLVERGRQVYVEGFDSSHDDEHTDREMVKAAICFAAYPDRVFKHIIHSEGRQRTAVIEHKFVDPWPRDWDKSWDKREGPELPSERDLMVKAAALLIAEIDRMDRNHGT